MVVDDPFSLLILYQTKIFNIKLKQKTMAKIVDEFHEALKANTTTRKSGKAKYPMLNIISTCLLHLGWITLVLTCLFSLSLIDSFSKALIPLYLFFGFLISVLCIATSELIRVLVDIEFNTRNESK